MRYCELIASLLCTRIMVSAKSWAMLTMVALGQRAVSKGIELVKITSASALSVTRSQAGPLINACSSFFHHIGCFANGAGGVDHIVDQHHILTFNIANDGHLLNHIGLGALLVAQHEGRVEVLGIGVGTLGATHIGRCDNHVVEFHLLDEWDEH